MNRVGLMEPAPRNPKLVSRSHESFYLSYTLTAVPIDSANVRRMVVKTAMLGNLKNPPEPFADVIRTHFRLKARSIMKQLDEWLKLDDGKPVDGVNQGGGIRANNAGSSTNGFQKDVEELKELLQKLIDGEEIEPGDGSGTS